MLHAAFICGLSDWRCSCCNDALPEAQKGVGEECQRPVKAYGETKETQKAQEFKQESGCGGDYYSSFVECFC